ncbi:MAG: hypothetical protein M1541_08775 [Acidobacteria bacterium]|nr:hypothetical protein [Acidobacteriota bacterium]
MNIVIVEGEGAINNIRQRTAREPIVQVEDENHRPVAGAVVVFTLPDRGASGVFPNGSHSTTIISDAQGRAVARGLRPNNVAGQYQVHVNASYQGMTGTATLTQTNVAAAAAGGAAAAGISAKLIAILAVAGAAVAGGVVVATRGGNNGSPTPAGPAAPPPVVITPGTATVGAPQ